VKSEISTYHDPLTGRKVRQLTSYKAHSHHLYFTNPGWWDNGRKLLFGSDRSGRTNLFSVDLEDGTITRHTDADMPGAPRETTFLFASVNPMRPEAYFWRGDQLLAIDLITNRERQLWTCPDGYMPNMINVTADGNAICSVIFEDVSDRFPVDLLHGYVGFREMWAENPHSQIIRVPVDGGPCETIWEEKYWIGHINTSPTQPHLLSFCHEGPWDAIDNRMWILDISSGKAWKLRERRNAGEMVGHEYWHADGITVGYHGYGSPHNFFGAVHFDNTNVRELAMEGQTGHVHSNDFSLIVGDGMGDAKTPALRLWKASGGKFDPPRLLCRHDGSFKSQVLHVHPRISPDGRTVVYTSDRTGYGQVYEVEIGDVNDLPFLT